MVWRAFFGDEWKKILLEFMTKGSVKSSIINSIGYDISTELLEIEFKRGDKRIYKNVPPSVHTAFVAASSVGKYFLSNIRGKYQYKSLTSSSSLVAGNIK
jgi:hypothetical protein